jgi:hypothetical protein
MKGMPRNNANPSATSGRLQHAGWRITASALPRRVTGAWEARPPRRRPEPAGPPGRPGGSSLHGRVTGARAPAAGLRAPARGVSGGRSVPVSPRPRDRTRYPRPRCPRAVLVAGGFGPQPHWRPSSVRGPASGVPRPASRVPHPASRIPRPASRVPRAERLTS